MTNQIIKSVLKETIQSLPDDAVFKPQSLPNVLSKAGVTQDELSWSQFEIPKVGSDPKGRVTKQDLVQAESRRADEFSVEMYEGEDAIYMDVAPEYMGASNPTYREKVYTFTQGGMAVDSTVFPHSSHFPQDDGYLAHTRIADLTISGRDTRVVMELQSDLHQQARKNLKLYEAGELIEDDYTRRQLQRAGASLDNFEEVYFALAADDGGAWELLNAISLKELPPEPLKRAMSKFYGFNGPYTEEAFDAFTATADFMPSVKGLSELKRGELLDSAFELLMGIRHNSYELPAPREALDEVSPLSGNWMRKLLERELADAIDGGKAQLAVPITGDEVILFQRGAGVQTDFYERQVVQTMQSLAKQMDADFEMVTTGATDDVVAGMLRSGELDSAVTMGLPANQQQAIARVVAGAPRTMSLATRGLKPVLEEMGVPLDKVTVTDLRKASQLAEEAGWLVDNMDGGMSEQAVIAKAADLGWTPDKGSIDDWAYALAEHHKLSNTQMVRELINMNDTVRHYAPPAMTYATIRPKATGFAADDEAYKTAIGQFQKGAISRDELAAKANEIRTKYGLTEAGLTDIPTPTQFVEAVNSVAPQWKRPSFNLYTSTSSVVIATALALQSYNQEEVNQYLYEQGYTPEEIMPLVQQYQQAKAQGYSDEEITQFLDSKELSVEKQAEEGKQLVPLRNVEADLQAWTMHKRHNKTQNIEKTIRAKYGMSGEEFERIAKNQPHVLTYETGYDHSKSAAFNALMNDTPEDMSVQDLVGLMEVVKPSMTSLFSTDLPAMLPSGLPAMFGRDDALQRYTAAMEKSQYDIQTMAKRKFGIELDWDGENWIAKGPDGMPTVVTPTFWQQMKLATGEAVGATAGAIGGTIAGYKAAPPALPLIGKLSKPAGGLLGGMAGGITGAVLGTEYDYMQAAMKLHVDMEAEVAAYKALSAAELAAVGEIIGYPAAKLLGLGWKGIMRAKNMVLDGNTQGAYQALKDVTFMTDEEIQAVVTRFETLQGPLKGTKEQKAIQAVTLTQPGMENVMSAAATYDPQAGRAIQKTLTERSASLLEATADLTDPQVARRFIADLQNYQSDVKTAYGQVKAEAAQSPFYNNFSFDYDELMIEPVLDNLTSKITDPTVQAKFLLQAQRVRGLSESRSFDDLIELRHLTNDFLYNTKISKADDKKVLREVINRIDEQIEQGAGDIFPDADRWLNQWAEARSNYAQMKAVERTALHRLIFDRNGNVKPVQPEAVVKAMAQHITSLDGSFSTVMDQLPLPARKQYEGAIVDYLAEKYTVGVEGGLRATRFPELAAELERINFTTPGARAAKNMINDFSETFKNDVHLAAVSTPMPLPHFQSYLTADPKVRAQFMVASGVFNTVQTWLPGQKQRNAALTKQVAKLLEKPLDVRTMNELFKEFATEPKLLQAMKDLQQATVRMAAQDMESTTPYIKLYGEGSTRMFKGTGPVTTLPGHRIATLEQVQEIAAAEGLTMESKSLDLVLAKYGYKAVLQGTDRVRLLGGQ